jgi:hypothetical protein
VATLDSKIKYSNYLIRNIYLKSTFSTFPTMAATCMASEVRRRVAACPTQ